MSDPKTSPLFTLRTLIVLLLGALALFYYRTSTNDPSEEAPVAPTPSPTTAVTPSRNEEEWLVKNIVSEIASLASYAGNREAAPLPSESITLTRLGSNPGRFKINVDAKEPVEFEIVLDEAGGSIWNPQRYVAGAKALLKAWGIDKGISKPETEAEEEALLKSLLTPTAEALQKENVRLSGRLTEQPLDVEAYEQAALLLGTLGMRENSGLFWETRSLCNRATATLAFAQALRDEEKRSDSATLAELLVGLLADTKAECEIAIGKLQERAQGRPVLASWATAASLRNTRDWRKLDEPSEGSLLERIEYTRALSEAVDADVAATKQGIFTPQEIPDWSRILLQYQFGVELGHQLFRSSLGSELREITQLFPPAAGGAATPETVAASLNQIPQGIVGKNEEGKSAVVIIDKGTWAQFSQRHLCHVIQNLNLFLTKKLGVPEEARNFRNSVSTFAKNLTFFPLLQLAGLEANPSPAIQRSAADLIQDHPEWISISAWNVAAKAGSPVPKIVGWISSTPPVVTYAFESRINAVSHLQGASNLADMEKIYTIAPWQRKVAERYLWYKTNSKPSAKEFEDVMGRFLDFNTRVMQDYAKLVTDDPRAYGVILTRAAQFDPYCYLTLSEYYVKRNMKEEGAKAFEAAIQNKADSIGIANKCGWLVEYYYDQGKKEEALALAKFAGEVYSARGLETLGKHYERIGDLKQAEEQFKNIQERYDDNSDLISFYQRQVDGNPTSPYASKLHSELNGLFPSGMKAAAVADFSGAPSSGVIILGESKILRENGLKRGDIITAIDGKRVDNFPQYALIRGLKSTPELELIIYRDGNYREVKAKAEGRRFNCDFETYPQ